MTAAAQQRIISRLQPLPDDREPVILRFIADIETETREASERKARANAFLNSFLNVELDEQVIVDFRERSTI